jgi:hypothetical protein
MTMVDTLYISAGVYNLAILICAYICFSPVQKLM